MYSLNYSATLLLQNLFSCSDLIHKAGLSVVPMSNMTENTSDGSHIVAFTICRIEIEFKFAFPPKAAAISDTVAFQPVWVGFRTRIIGF